MVSWCFHYFSVLGQLSQFFPVPVKTKKSSHDCLWCNTNVSGFGQYHSTSSTPKSEIVDNYSDHKHAIAFTLSDDWVGEPLPWRHNDPDAVSNHQPHDCLLNRLFGRRSKKTSQLRVTGLCAGNSQVVGEFTAQMASDAENVSIWWRHHAKRIYMNIYIH